jgi:UDP-2-acetamido-3-amino-2,3-dideoxy-glucuronate N-acetyltransferase
MKKQINKKENYCCICRDAIFGRNVRLYSFVNIYGKVDVGDECVIGAFVEIQPDVKIGNRVKISSHTFICTGVEIEDDAFIGHGVMFTNDRYPRSVDEDGRAITAADTKVVPTLIKRGAAIGSNATILCGVTVGEGAMIGAGSVVTRDVDAYSVVCGNPARPIRKRINNRYVP